MVLMYIALGYICVLLLIFCLRRENKIRDAGKRFETISADGTTSIKERIFSTEEEAVSEALISLSVHSVLITREQRIILGDKYSGFRYRL